MGEFGQLGEYPCRIFDNAQGSVCMNDCIIPCGDSVASFLFGRVPRGRDVGLRAMKDRQRFGVFEIILQEGIVSREVSAQCAEGFGGWRQIEGDVVGVDAVFSVGDECCKRIRLDQGVEREGVGFFERFWDVHRLFFLL